MREIKYTTSSGDNMQALGVKLGKQARGSTVIELVGDVGAGKTTLTKGIARGLGIKNDISSPSFTLSRTYVSPRGFELHHYDFYRLENIGLLLHQLQESLEDPNSITVIEWAKSATTLLPENRLTVVIKTISEDSRSVIIRSKEEIIL